MTLLLGPRRPCPTCDGTGCADAQLALLPEVADCLGCFGFLEAEDTEDELLFNMLPGAKAPRLAGAR